MGTTSKLYLSTEGVQLHSTHTQVHMRGKDQIVHHIYNHVKLGLDVLKREYDKSK